MSRADSLHTGKRITDEVFNDMERTMNVGRMENIISVFGSFDENLRMIEKELGVKVTDRDSEIHIVGDEEQTA